MQHWNDLFDNCAGHSPVQIGNETLLDDQSTSGSNSSVDQFTSGSDSSVDQTSTSICDKVEFESNLTLLRNMVKAKDFMKGVMDECTHLANYEQPVDPELIIIVVAEDDYYVARKDLIKLNEIWPGSQLRLIKGRGHVSSIVRDRNLFM